MIEFIMWAVIPIVLYVILHYLTAKRKITVVISDTIIVKDNMTIPSNVTLKFLRGGKLYVSNGKTITTERSCDL